MKKQSRFNRILSGILVLITLLSLMPHSVYGKETTAVEHPDASMLRIARMGETVDILGLAAHERLEITADGAEPNAAFQWQILHPEKENVWINIYDATHGYLYVTLALVRNMMTEDNIASLRCRVTEGEQVRYTSPVTVRFDPEVPYIPETTPATEPVTETLPDYVVMVPETTAPAQTEAPTVPVETEAPAVTESTVPMETEAPTEPETTVPAETAAPTVPEATAPAETAAPTVPEATAPAETAAPTVPETIAPAETLAPMELETMPAMVKEEDTELLSKRMSLVASGAEETEAAPVPETAAPVETAPAVVAEDTAAAQAAAADPVDPENSEFVTVTINYVRYDFKRDEGKLIPEPANETDKPEAAVYYNGYEIEMTNAQAYTPYKATLQKGSGLTNTTVNVPTMMGYAAYLNDGENPITSVFINETKIENDITYTVSYKPARVNYTVRYYFQNIYDDQYVENTTMKITAQGLTGMTPPESHLHLDADDVDTVYAHLTPAQRTDLKAMLPGFLSLYYQPDAIAADGSTVFEVYYERNYFLMEFNCNGGYGAETLYNRYGSYINVPNPVKAGYVFDGWDLLDGTDANGKQVGDGTANTLPLSMPAQNTAYIALWDTTNTTYTVAYWLEHANGSKSYLGSRDANATSGTFVSGSPDLTADMLLCNYPEHTHTEDCFKCEHVHNDTCFSGYVGKGTSEPSDDEMTAMRALGAGEPEDGYVYAIAATATTTHGAYTWTRAKSESDWYGWEYKPGDEIFGQKLSSVTVTVATTGGAREYTITKYRVSGIPQNCTDSHNHDDDELICNTHAHSDACKVKDLAYMQYLRADSNVLVEGDGSAVVNVYYQYKEYTLKFYYAMSSGSGDNIQYYVIGGSTYYFGNLASGDAQSNEIKALDYYMSYPGSSGSLRGNATEKPELNAKGLGRGYQLGSDASTVNSTDYTYYYISFKARYGDDISGLWPCDVFESVTMEAGYNASSADEEQEAMVSAWNGEHHVKYSSNDNQTIKGNYERLNEELLWAPKYGEPDDATIAYLCFWENGAKAGWNVPELYRYNIWLACIDNKQENAPAGKPTKQRGDVWYYLDDSYDTCDDSNVASQTHPMLTGFTQNGRDSYDINVYDTEKYHDAFGVNFYFLRKTHTLYFWNHNDYLATGGHGIAVEYGESLEDHGNQVTADKMNNRNNEKVIDPKTNEAIDTYPKGLEPGAYEFIGWYTSPVWNDAARANWNDTVPDSDLTFYARWEPIKRDVLFFTYYDDIAKLETTYTGGIAQYIEDRKAQLKDENDDNDEKPEYIPYGEAFDADHGETLDSQDIELVPTFETDDRIPKRVNEAGKTVNRDTFIGWFYMDEDNKKRFAPDTMEITQDLILFGEWQSSIDTTYKVEYVLKDAVTVDGITYPAGTAIADPTEGHSSVGKTKTFNSKAAGELYTAYQTSYFPENNSHSILMKEQNADNTENSYKFKYVYDAKVFYKIRYLERGTNKVLAEEKVLNTNKAVVTEKFLPVTGYIPESYYIRKTLKSDGTENDGQDTTTNVDADNVITFYYVKDTLHGVYAIEHYLESADGTYTQYETIVASADLMTDGQPTVVRADIRNYEGYAHIPTKNTVITYENDGEENAPVVGVITSEEEKDPVTGEVITPADNRPYGTVSTNGLTIKLYYNRKSYPYTVEYWIAGSETDPSKNPTLEGKLTLTENGTTVIPYGRTEKFGSSASHSLYVEDADGIVIRDHRTFKIGDNTYEFYPNDPSKTEEEQTKSITIRADETGKENRIIFYFIQKKVEVFYNTVCTDPSITVKYGAVNIYSEKPTDTGTLSGSTATPASGFRFAGWFTDKECKSPVNAAWVTNTYHLTPGQVFENLDDDTEENDWKNHYYALFEPVRKDLTIQKIGENLDANDSFLFRLRSDGTDAIGQTIDLTVAIQGAGSVTIPSLYCGSYTVEELTNWSWAYAPEGDTTQTVNVQVTGENSYTAAFTNQPKSVQDYKWLHGENHTDNKFASVG